MSSSVFLKSVNLFNQGSLWRTAKANFFNEMHISDIEGKICCQDLKNIGSQGYTQAPPSPSLGILNFKSLYFFFSDY